MISHSTQLGIILSVEESIFSLIQEYFTKINDKVLKGNTINSYNNEISGGYFKYYIRKAHIIGHDV